MQRRKTTGWDTATFLPEPPAALARTIDGIACTLIDKGDHWVLAWAINLGDDATLPDAEAVIGAGAAAIVETLDRLFGDRITYRADGDDDDDEHPATA